MDGLDITQREFQHNANSKAKHCYDVRVKGIINLPYIKGGPLVFKANLTFVTTIALPIGSALDTEQVKVHRRHNLLDQPRRGSIQIPSVILC